MTRALPSLPEAKAQARRLRTELAAQGTAIGHGQALERVAKSHGFRDWNAMRAAIAERPPAGWHPGGRVRGRYLSQDFTATVLRADPQPSGWYRLTLDLDEAIDVVRFDSFSSFRKRISATVGPAGSTRERTSDGAPHLQLDMSEHESGADRE